MKHETLIGIDPDCDKSGVATYNRHTKELLLENLTFFELYEKLRLLKGGLTNPMLVRIEAGWLNKKSNYHFAPSKAAGEKIAKAVGSNHEVGRKIVEACEHLGIAYELVRPTASKVGSAYFEKLTGIKRSNQEVRDAALLVFGY